MKINLYLIRHGESLANISYLEKIFKDPNLSENGIQQCNELKEFLKKEELFHKKIKIFTSILVRTQETALLSIPKKKIYISNHLKELGHLLQLKTFWKGSNFPRNIKIQQENINKILKKPFLKRLSYEKGILDKKNNYIDSVFYQEGDIEIFLKENILKFKEGMTVFIFCHGHLIRKFLKIKEKIKNCSVFHITNQKDKTFSIDNLSNKKKFKIIFRPQL